MAGRRRSGAGEDMPGAAPRSTLSFLNPGTRERPQECPRCFSAAIDARRETRAYACVCRECRHQWEETFWYVWRTEQYGRARQAARAVGDGDFD